MQVMQALQSLASQNFLSFELGRERALAFQASSPLAIVATASVAGPIGLASLACHSKTVPAFTRENFIQNAAHALDSS